MLILFFFPFSNNKWDLIHFIHFRFEERESKKNGINQVEFRKKNQKINGLIPFFNPINQITQFI